VILCTHLHHCGVNRVDKYKGEVWRRLNIVDFGTLLLVDGATFTRRRQV
jgi:hypothetical protein